MRMGQPIKKRRPRGGKAEHRPLFAPGPEGTRPTVSELRPKYSSKQLKVGRVSSNVISSVLWPDMVEAATACLEQYADAVIGYDDEVLLAKKMREAEVDDEVGDEAGEAEAEADAEADMDADGTVHVDAAAAPPPAQHFVYKSEQSIEDLIELVLKPTSELFSKSNDWKVHANAAKFERLLDEKYGPLRPFVDKYPQIERTVRSVQRKYARGEFSPLRQGDPPIPISTAVVILFMMKRNNVRMDALIASATFFLLGLQPWALLVLVALGEYLMSSRRKRAVGGMSRHIPITEPYYAVAEEGADSKLGRMNDLLREAIGQSMAEAASALKAEGKDKYDIIVLGSGPATLYSAALLSRAGKTVLVLSPDGDASGCVSLAKGETGAEDWDGVPFDVHSNNVTRVSKQQPLLAPALASKADAQGGIRFATIGSKSDAFAHTILSIPGAGTNSHEESTPFILRAGGMQPIAQDAAAALGDGWHESDSLSTQYLQFCQTVHNTASDFLMSKLLPDQINKLRSTDAYQESGTRYATSYLNKLLPLNGHVRAFMAGMGMKDENIRPGMLSMAAHVTSIGGLLSPEGLAYPIGGPRAVCKALEAVILQSGGKVVSNAIIKELVFEEETSNDAETKEEDKEDDKPSAPQCIGISFADGQTITVREGGAIVSMRGFIPTFVSLLNPDLRTKHGVPRGLPALTERRPLLKILVGLRGTSDDLSITGADWFRLPNASRAYDRKDPQTGEVQLGEIGLGRGSSGSEEEEKAREESPDDVNDADDGKGSERRGKHSKKPDRRNKFDTGVSWIKISFPSAKDPSWNDRYPGKSTCVITIEADNDFVTKFESKPAIYSSHKVDPGAVSRLMQRAMKDLIATYPQLDGKVEFSKLMGPFRAGLSHNPERFAAKGVVPKTLYPGLYVGGSDLTAGDSFSSSIVGGWLAANAVMDYDFIDYLYLGKNITSDINQFLTAKSSGQEVAVPYTPKPEAAPSEKDVKSEKGLSQDSAAAEPSKEK